ncbi:Uncharacterised protein [Vibrio cholerae]|nr:Uncharacterised protein [Vibrio cholerae]CSI25346.1 Uncharacterised protein [Vibrio cholerae]
MPKGKPTGRKILSFFHVHQNYSHMFFSVSVGANQDFSVVTF